MVLPASLRRLLGAVSVLFALPSDAPSQTGFHASLYSPTRNVQRLAPVQAFLAQTRVLDLIGEALNQAIALPHPVAVAGAECGQANAFYRPAEKRVIICYELVEDVIEEFRSDGLTSEQFGEAVAGATIFVLLHETGHALVDVLQLPITGREEDAVDQFAALILAEETPNLAFWAAQYWLQRNDFGDTGLFKVDPTPFSDEHGLDAQRFYNILCWTYGRSPSNRTALLRYIPQARAIRCPAESEQINRAWETLLADHRHAGPAHPQPARGKARIDGDWAFSETLGRAGTAFHCQNEGVYAFRAAGTALGVGYRQTGRCTILGQAIDNPGAGSTNGEISAGEIRFAVDDCTYVGRVDATGTRINGTVACRLELAGIGTDIEGTWAASRR